MTLGQVGIEPYYDRDGITIYNADCNDVLPSIDPASVDLVLADPPYGIGLTGNYANTRDTSREYAKIYDDDKAFDPSHLLRYKRLVLWGANNFSSRLPDAPAWLVWDKACQDMPTGFRNAEAELAWTNVTRRMQVKRHQWIGAAREGERGLFLHPTQKPVGLMKWVLERWTKPGDLVLDPYMGSGPVAAAAYQLGRRYIGIELVTEYCDAAINRLAQPTLGLTTEAAHAAY